MIEAFKRFFRNYANFKGRSNRGDYWWVILCNFIIGFIFGFVYGICRTQLGEEAIITKGLDLLYSIYLLAIIIPALALIVRRLHDINKSGWYYFMILIPIAGPIIFLIYMLTNSVNEGNQYGERVL